MQRTGYFLLQWPQSWAPVEITAKELVPLVVAAALWGQRWSGNHIRFHTDNEAVVAIIKKRNSKDLRLTPLLRCLFFFQYSAIHIPGVLNTAADALSRNDLTLFSSLFPQIPMVLVPKAVEELLVLNPPDWGSNNWTELFTLSLHRGLPPPP